MSDEPNNADNVDTDVMKSYVERLFNIEQGFADVKAEYTDSKADLKTEIKGRSDETGVDFKQVAALVKNPHERSGSSRRAGGARHQHVAL